MSPKVLEFGRSSGRAKGVSGTVEGHGDEGQARLAESQSGSSTTPAMAGSRSVTLGRSVLRDSVVTCHIKDNAAQTEQVSTQASPADSLNPRKRSNGTFDNGPRRAL